jgi:glycosyltransferase involved in cell wall biosynthesis
VAAQVDIVITTFNRPKLVRRAVRSVLEQSYPNVRLIVVDDTSDTDTLEALGDDVNRLEYIRHERNRGAPAARNTGLDCAEGDYVGFLDDDDEYLCSKLEDQLRVLEAASESAIGVDCGAIVLTDDGPVPVRASLGPSGGKDLILHRFAGAMTPTILYRRDRVHDLRFDEALPAYQEYDFLLRALERGPVIPLDIPLVRLHDHHGARVTNHQSHLAALERLRDKYAGLIEPNPAAVLAWARKVGLLHLKVGDAHAASREFRRAAASRVAPAWFRLIARTPPVALPVAWKSATWFAARRGR